MESKIKFYGGKTHLKDMGKNEVDRFLSYLTEKKNVAAATQKQALISVWFKSGTFYEAVINSVLTIIRLKI